MISTYVAGIPELVKDRENGWLVPAGDARTLALSMIAVLDTAETELHKMGVAGKHRVNNRHDVTKEAAKLSTLFHGVCE